MRKRKWTVSRFYCKECNSMTPLARYFPAREKGHVKHFWCYKCQKEQAHIEEQQFAHKHEGEIY